MLGVSVNTFTGVTQPARPPAAGHVFMFYIAPDGIAFTDLKLEQKWRTGTRAHASVGDANHVTKSHVVMLK